MKHIKAYEKFISFDQNKIISGVKRGLKHSSDIFSGFREITIDKDTFVDKKEIAKNIYKVIDNFRKIQKNFGLLRYKKVSGSFTDFLYSYDSLIQEYGYRPINIKKELIEHISSTFLFMKSCYGAWISKHKKINELYIECQSLLKKIQKQYNELEDITKQYNL